MFGLEKDKSITKTDMLLEIFIYSFIYIFFEYFIGLLIGFIKSPYNLNLLRIIENIFPLLVSIILEEISRYIILTKGKGNNLIKVLSIILFILFDTMIGIGIYDITNKVGIFETIILVILPSVSKNILLTSISNNAGYKPCILYRSILELFIYIVPIYADLGNYLDSILKIVFPLIFLLRLRLTYYKKNTQDIRKNNKVTKIITCFLLLILSSLVILVSGYFKYYLLVIATGSMEPNISIGDAVLIEKLDESELDRINKGDVLVYKYEKKIIVHRVTNIDKIDNKYIYKTKGDANNEEDNWLVYENQIIGIVKFNVKYIGYPTVKLNNYLNH